MCVMAPWGFQDRPKNLQDGPKTALGCDPGSVIGRHGAAIGSSWAAKCDFLGFPMFFDAWNALGPFPSGWNRTE